MDSADLDLAHMISCESLSGVEKSRLDLFENDSTLKSDLLYSMRERLSILRPSA